MAGHADDVTVQTLGGLTEGLGDLPAGDELDARGDASHGGLGRDEGAQLGGDLLPLGALRDEAGAGRAYPVPGSGASARGTRT